MSPPPKKRKQPESNHSISDDDVRRAAELLMMLSRNYFAQADHVAPDRAQSQGETKDEQENLYYRQGTPEKAKCQDDVNVKFEKVKSQRRGRIHQCMLCPKSFSSGQALGGHQRLHYQGIIKKRKVEKVKNVICDLNIDLNHDPAPDCEIGQESSSTPKDEEEIGEKCTKECEKEEEMEKTGDNHH